MKRTASTRFELSRVSIQMMRLLVLLSLMSLTSSFTPPKIIYGGWTPILPGHPFFFGTARKKHYESSLLHHESPYIQSSPQYLQHIHPPEPHGDHDNEDHHAGYGRHHSTADVYQHQSQQYGDHLKESHGRPHKHSKNIFSYYPPQSSYDSPPKHQNLNYKPVYLEVPRKPLDVLEDPRQYVPYILPTIRSLLPKDFKLPNSGHEQTYLKITPLGKVDPNSIRPVGHINLDKIRYIHGDSLRDGQLTNHLRSHDSPLYPPLPHVESDLFVNNKQLYSEDPHKVRESVNIFKGTHFPAHHRNAQSSNPKGNEYRNVKGGQDQYVIYQHPRESKSTNTSPYYTKAGGFKHQTYLSNHPIVSHTKIYPTTIEVYPDDKFTPSHHDPSIQSDDSKELFSSGGNNPVNVLRSKKYPQTVYAIGGPKLYVSPSRYQYSPYEALKNSYMPKVLDHFVYKNTKTGKRYRKPRILADIHGSPAIVDREVAIVHVPVEQSYASRGKSYPDQIEAHSTPHSVQILGYHNGSKLYDPRSHPNPHFIIDESYRQHATDDGSQDIDVEGLNVKESDAIFVGTRGLDASEVQKVTETSEEPPVKDVAGSRQFFHAYYASTDHVPPKGYTKMTLDEFKNLFQNAEIQHIPRKQADELRLRRESEKRND